VRKGEPGTVKTEFKGDPAGLHDNISEAVFARDGGIENATQEVTRI
jgi:hypothetical protein